MEGYLPILFGSLVMGVVVYFVGGRDLIEINQEQYSNVEVITKSAKELGLKEVIKEIENAMKDKAISKSEYSKITNTYSKAKIQFEMNK